MLPLFAACTADYSPATPAGDLLPPDTYPLQIASLTIAADGQPGTRLADNGNATSWQPGDQVMVSLGDRQAIYTYNADTDTWQSDAPLYWQSKAPQTVNAWYPVTAEIDFTQQHIQGLTYLLKAEPVEATYGQEEPVNLTFHHQLAKVRVVLEGAKAQDVASVTVRSYPKSINDKGTLGDRTGGDPIYVSMLQTTYEGQPCWEATLRDGTLQAGDSFKVAAEGGTPMQVVLDKDISIKAGEVYTINISVEQAPTEIDLSTYEGPTLAVSGKTTIKGNGQQKNLQVTVEPDTELTLQDVSISYEEGPTIICQGNAHITLSGNNKLSPASKGINYLDNNTLGSGIEVRSSGTLTIESEPNAALDITRRRNEGPGITPMYGAGIGLYDNANLVIKGGTITVTGGSPSVEGGANIGGFVSKDAGTITLEGGTFTLQDQCMRSTLVGAGYSGTCGMVTIRAGVTINGTTYKEDHIGAIQE